MAGIPFKMPAEALGSGNLVNNINNAFSKGLQNYLDATYKPRILENSATKGEIGNLFMPREKESNLAHQAASTQGLNINNLWAPRMHQSSLNSADLNRQKLEMELNPAKKMEYIQKMFQAMNSSPMFQSQEGVGGGGGAPEEMPVAQNWMDALRAKDSNNNASMGGMQDMDSSSGMENMTNGGASGGGGTMGQSQVSQEQMKRYFLKQMGFDPDYQSPQAKQAAALNLYRQKQAIKNSSNMGDTATQAMLTENQRALQGIDASIPIIDDILRDKNLPGITTFSPGKNAAYNAKTGAIIDKLIAAQGLPKVQASIDLVSEQIRRQRGETVSDYKDRLKVMREDLLARRKMAQNTVESRKIGTETPNYDANAQQGIMKGYSAGKTLNLATGKWE